MTFISNGTSESRLPASVYFAPDRVWRELTTNLCRHEHLYADIEDRLIRSDHFGHAFDAKNHIGHTSVMLCTLSMLSNPGLDHHGFFRHVPVERLIVDEASQIDTFEFMVRAACSFACLRLTQVHW